MIAAEREVSRSAGTLRVLAMWLVAALAAMITILPMLGLGLFVPMIVLAPVTVLAGGVLAGVVAGWIGNGFSADGSRSRLVPVVAVAVVAGLVVAALASLVTLLAGSSAPMIGYALAVVVGIGAGAAWAADRLRGPGRRTGRDIVLTLALMLGSAAVIVLTVTGLCATVVVCRA